MPRTKMNILELTAPEVEDKIRDLKKELFHLRFRNAMRQLDNPLQIHYLRKDVARLMTALTEHRQGIRSLATGENVSAEASKETAKKTKKGSRGSGKKKE